MTSPHEWQPGDEEVEKIVAQLKKDTPTLRLMPWETKRVARAVIRSSPYPRIAEALDAASELIEWRMDPGKEGVQKVIDQIDASLSALQPPATGGE